METWSEGWLTALREAGLMQNRWLQAALILGVAWILAWVVDRFLARQVTRWTGRTTSAFDDRLVRILHTPVRISVVLVGLTLATHRLAFPEPYTRYTLSVIKTVAVVVWLLFLLRLLELVFETMGRSETRWKALDERTLPLFNNMAKIAVAGFGAYFLFLSWGVNVAALVTSLGIAGVAVGFAARETLANLLAGVAISADAPYKVGDFIVLDSGERGRVTRIGLRSSRLLTRDDIEVTVPNSVLGDAKIVNESGGPWEKERVRIAVGVAYGSDLDQVYRILLETAAEEDNVCAHPEPRVRFRRFGDSALEMELLAWIDEPVLRGRTIHHLNTEIYKRFQREGIKIPFPQREVHVKSWPGAPPTPAAIGTSDGSAEEG